MVQLNSFWFKRLIYFAGTNLPLQAFRAINNNGMNLNILSESHEKFKVLVFRAKQIFEKTLGGKKIAVRKPKIEKTIALRCWRFFCQTRIHCMLTESLEFLCVYIVILLHQILVKTSVINTYIGGLENSKQFIIIVSLYIAQLLFV